MDGHFAQLPGRRREVEDVLADQLGLLFVGDERIPGSEFLTVDPDSDLVYAVSGQEPVEDHLQVLLKSVRDLEELLTGPAAVRILGGKEPVQLLPDDHGSRGVGEQGAYPFLEIGIVRVGDHPVVDGLDEIEVQGESAKVAVFRVTREDDDTSALGQGRGLQSEAVSTQLTAFVTALRTEPQCLRETVFSHPATVVDDEYPGIPTVVVDSDIDRGRSSGDAVVDQVCNRGLEAVADVAQ